MHAARGASRAACRVRHASLVREFVKERKTVIVTFIEHLSKDLRVRGGEPLVFLVLLCRANCPGRTGGRISAQFEVGLHAVRIKRSEMTLSAAMENMPQEIIDSMKAQAKRLQEAAERAARPKTSTDPA